MYLGRNGLYVLAATLFALLLLYTGAGWGTIVLMIIVDIVLAIRILVTYRNRPKDVPVPKHCRLPKFVLWLAGLSLLAFILNVPKSAACFLVVLLTGDLYYTFMYATEAYRAKASGGALFRLSVFLPVSIILAYVAGLCLYGVQYNPVIHEVVEDQDTKFTITVTKRGTEQRVTTDLDTYRSRSWRHEHAMLAYADVIRRVSSVSNTHVVYVALCPLCLFSAVFLVNLFSPRTRWK